MTALRIWDFRRGDDDDNRTSPHGGGLRRVLISAALEFNYVKAAIGFLVLIIGPALLVGIVPSVLVTYGRLKFGAAASVGEYPIVAVIVLVVLAGGRSLDRPAASPKGRRELLAPSLHARLSGLRRSARDPALDCRTVLR